MKKLFLVLFLLTNCMLIAGIASLEGYSDKAMYIQFSYDQLTNTGDYFNAYNEGQNWLGAQTIMLNINAEMDLWVSNYVSSWYWPKPLESLDGNVFDMGSGNYGVFDMSGREWLGNGQTAVVTYFDEATKITNSTDAYYVGHFQGGEKVFFSTTTLPKDGSETVDSLQYVYDSDHDTSLWSRLNGTHDLAGNVRINFGLENHEAHEFVAFGVSEPLSGQPLPSVMMSCLIGTSVMLIEKKFKKK